MKEERKNRLIVALDVDSLQEGSRFVRLLKEKVSLFKVGLGLFTTAGPDAVKMVRDEGAKVFLDLKFHDIPTTVARACEAAASLNPFMLNVHVSGGPAMMEAASRAVRSKSLRTIVLGVTILTSDPSRPETIKEVVRLSQEAQKSGLDGVVCSAQEAASVRGACGPDFVIVTPGIRPSGSRPDDQNRTATPMEAIKNGADYLVIGRPILSAKDPLAAVASLLEEICGSPI